MGVPAVTVVVVMGGVEGELDLPDAAMPAAAAPPATATAIRIFAVKLSPPAVAAAAPNTLLCVITAFAVKP